MDKKIYIDTLGCSKNTYDSGVLAAGLVDKGCQIVFNPEEANVLIVNTCGFIESAKRESIQRIFELSSEKADSKKQLIVTGCLSERYRNDLIKEMPEVDIFFGVDEYEKLIEVLTSEPAKANGQYFDEGSYIGYLKIAEGCDNNCTFCAIPKIRGKYRSKPIEECLIEAKKMATFGIKELIIIAQDTSQYGIDLYGKVVLPKLLKELCKIEEFEMIRLMYVYDNGITDELIEVISLEDKICKYIDIPIQHISDNVLHRMNRRSTGKSIRETIKKLRIKIPGIHIRTTLLVGFPGETDSDFEELLDFIDEYKIDRLGAFGYSDEDGTAAFNLDDKVDINVIERRVDAVMQRQMDISARINQDKIGKNYKVIVDEEIEKGMYAGRMEFDAPEIDCEVTFESKMPHVPGDIVNVIILNAFEYDLEGEEIL